MPGSTFAHTLRQQRWGEEGGREVYKKGICVHMVSITRSHFRFRINRLYCTITCPSQSRGGDNCVPSFFHLVSFPPFLSFSFFVCMETGGWGGGVIALCFAFLSCYLGGFFGWIVFFLVFVLWRGDGGMWAGQGGKCLKDGVEEW